MAPYDHPSTAADHAVPRTDADAQQFSVDIYVSPRLERLGTLAELTQGGSGPDADGLGGSGDEGSV